MENDDRTYWQRNKYWLKPIMVILAAIGVFLFIISGTVIVYSIYILIRYKIQKDDMNKKTYYQLFIEPFNLLQGLKTKLASAVQGGKKIFKFSKTNDLSKEQIQKLQEAEQRVEQEKKRQVEEKMKLEEKEKKRLEEEEEKLRLEEEKTKSKDNDE